MLRSHQKSPTHFNLILKTGFALGVTFGLVHCGPKLSTMQGKTESESDPTQKPSQEELVSIPVKVEEKKSNKAAFALAVDATAFNISLDSCKSGLTGTATQANPSIKVYKFDQDCLAKLTSFQVNGSTFVPSVADPFSTWIAGDTATFQDSLDANNKIKVTVSNQLASPVSGSDSIGYVFSAIAAGIDQTFAESVVSQPKAISVSGLGAPDFKVKELSYVGMTSLGGGQFQFKLECNANLTGTGATAACQGMLLSKIRYKLVKDTYGGTLDITTAASLFPTGSVTIDAAEIIPVGNAALPKGGFTTPISTDPEVLTGPSQMHLNSKMLLVLEGDATSYTYFKVDVTTITN
jgi:hypothetical protein